MADLILALIIVLIVFFSGYHLYTEKRKGSICVGCPYGKQCGKKTNCNCEKK